MRYFSAMSGVFLMSFGFMLLIRLADDNATDARVVLTVQASILVTGLIIAGALLISAATQAKRRD